MDIEGIRNFAMGLKGVEESFPFGPNTLVFKTVGKMFLLLSMDEIPLRINVKCEPEKAEELRARYTAVLPGYHMNKKHWNTVICDDTIGSGIVKDFIRQSYDLVRGKQRK